MTLSAFIVIIVTMLVVRSEHHRKSYDNRNHPNGDADDALSPSAQGAA